MHMHTYKRTPLIPEIRSQTSSPQILSTSATSSRKSHDLTAQSSSGMESTFAGHRCKHISGMTFFEREVLISFSIPSR